MWASKNTAFRFFQKVFSLSLVLGLLGHGVQGASVLEPLNLGLVEGLQQLDLKGAALLRVDNHGKGLSNGELGARNVNLQRALAFTILFYAGCQGRGELTLSSGLILS